VLTPAGPLLRRGTARQPVWPRVAVGPTGFFSLKKNVLGSFTQLLFVTRYCIFFICMLCWIRLIMHLCTELFLFLFVYVHLVTILLVSMLLCVRIMFYWRASLFVCFGCVKSNFSRCGGEEWLRLCPEFVIKK
jgi:hypothetical protein